MSLGAMFESARELTLEAASSAARLIDGAAVDSSDIRKLLRSHSERDRMHGLRAVQMHMSQGVDVREFFADIVKNVNSADPDVRRIVYAYLVRYADHEPDLALMTINGIQKYLGDKQPVVRSLALKVMSSIRIPTIAPIVALAIRELAHDDSPIVRISCCQAIGKCYVLDPSLGPDLLDSLMLLAKDKRSVEVQGWATAVLAHYFPNRLDLLHKLYKSICASLSAYPEWCQTVVLPFIVSYCRHFMSSNEPDLKPLMLGCEPILMSLNSAVVLEAAALYYYLAPESVFSSLHVAGNVMRLPPTELVLKSVLVLAKARGDAFKPYITRFFLDPSDHAETQILKLRVLAILADEKTMSTVLGLLKFYAETTEDEKILRAVMETIASCAAHSSTSTHQVNKWLLRVIVANESPLLVSQALFALRFLTQQGTEHDGREFRGVTLTHLARILGNTDLPEGARTTILWLIGEYCNEQPALAAEVLRKAIKSLPREAPSVRLQMIQLAAKVYSHYLANSEAYDPRVPDFFKHIIYLGRYDPDYDNRDRARFFSSLLLDDSKGDLATLLLQATKPAPTFIQQETADSFRLGSSSLFFGHPFSGYISLEDWSGVGSSNLREDSPPAKIENNHNVSSDKVSPWKSVSPSPAPSSRKPVSLEEFLGSDESSSEQSSEDETSSGEIHDSESSSGEEDERA